jgi:hypothetical protein
LHHALPDRFGLTEELVFKGQVEFFVVPALELVGFRVDTISAQTASETPSPGILMNMPLSSWRALP